MERLVAVLAVVALLVTGCGRPAPGGKAAAPPKRERTVVAAIVEFDSTGGRREARTLRKIDQLGVTTLPIDPYGDSDVELSADGHTLLYTPTPAQPTAAPTFMGIPARYSEADEVCALDVSSEATRAVFHGPSVTYGFDSRGRLVVLAGRGPEDSRRMMTQGPFLSDLSLVTINGSATETRSVDTSAFARLTDLRFLGADDKSVYLLGVVTGIMNGGEQDLWQLDRASGRATRIAKWTFDGFAPEGERWQSVSERLRLPASEAITAGLPAISIIESGFPDQGGVSKTGKPVMGHASFGIPTAVVFDRLPGMRQVRSIPITQPSHMSSFVQAVSLDLARCLTQPQYFNGSGPPVPFFEQSASGVTTITVAQSLKSRPEPIGYFGDDIVYSFYQAPSVRIAIWHRGSGDCRVLGALPPGEWANKPKFLGVEYER